MASAKHGADTFPPGVRRGGPGRLRPWLVCAIAGLLAVFALTNIWALLAGRPVFATKSLGLFSVLLPAAYAQASHSELPYYGRSPPVYPSRKEISPRHPSPLRRGDSCQHPAYTAQPLAMGRRISGGPPPTDGPEPSSPR